MCISAIGASQLKRLDPTGKLVFNLINSGNACITSRGNVYLSEAFAKQLINCEEVLEFDDGTIYSPTAEERIGGVMAHEVGHMQMGHLKDEKPSAKRFLIFGFCSTVSLLGAYVLALIVLRNRGNAQMKFVLAIAAYIGLAALSGLGAFQTFLKEKNQHREQEHEADLYGMDRLREIDERPEVMLWLKKALAALCKSRYSPDASLFKKLVYHCNATHPIPLHRYRRCLEHLS